MKMLFLDDPMLSCKDYLQSNNVDIIKKYANHASEVEAIYVHNTFFRYEDYPNLEYILCPMTGIAHLDPIPKHIKVFNLDDREWLYHNVWSTAEHTLSLAIRLTRGLARELRNAKVGFLGFGRVAQQVVELLHGFNCSIKYFDPKEVYYKPDFLLNVLKVEDPMDVFSEVDVVFICMAETKLTKGMVDYRMFNNCTEQPIIINTARTSLIKYNHLIQALSDGKIMGFGLDVDIDDIPEGQRSTIVDYSKIYRGVIVTPHIAGKSLPSRILTDKFVLNKFITHLGGFSCL